MIISASSFICSKQENLHTKIGVKTIETIPVLSGRCDWETCEIAAFRWDSLKKTYLELFEVVKSMQPVV